MGILRQRKKKKSILPKLIVLIILAWFAGGSYFSYKATKKIEKLKIPQKEVKILKTIKFFPSYTTEIENIGKIISNQNPSEKHGWLFKSSYKKILDNLLFSQYLPQFGKLTEYLSENGKKEEFAYYYGLYLFNKGEFAKAKDYLKDNSDFEKIYASGKIPVINGILDYDINSGKYKAKYRGLKFLETVFPKNRNFLVSYTSTIKPEIQDLAETTLGNREGFFAVARQGELLAIVANGVNPFTDYYEPGSVIKLITLTAYLSEGRKDVKFPFYCKEPLNIDGKALYDWKKHGEIPSFEEAIACSCNLVFGECALSLGKSTLLKWFSKFYIDNNKKIKVCEVEFNPAKLKNEITDRYTLAKAGIGLEIPEVSPYWLIKTASTFARNGRDSFPTCVRFKKLLGNEKSETAVNNMTFTCDPKKDYVFDYPKVKPVYEGMFKAVELPIGTGRRAKVEGLKIFLKTGTAGDKPLNAFVIGFAKRNNADYSFALFLKNGGKAEYEAAQTVKNFFNSFKNIY